MMFWGNKNLPFFPLEESMRTVTVDLVPVDFHHHHGNIIELLGI